ncbi:hypothetical protein FNV43_RR26018 [Rhamnella rubrinervis]|uniref:Uncharacterized protein n=1 Tax=Rhamnella rubrinervis TaxID=2594499 RepID=A0A8K0DLT9_9ROSA|nr:hypothetical protein FNV43_RR26018 [Rhamnella rubrinervis]
MVKIANCVFNAYYVLRRVSTGFSNLTDGLLCLVFSFSPRKHVVVTRSSVPQDTSSVLSAFSDYTDAIPTICGVPPTPFGDAHLMCPIAMTAPLTESNSDTSNEPEVPFLNIGLVLKLLATTRKGDMHITASDSAVIMEGFSPYSSRLPWLLPAVLHHYILIPAALRGKDSGQRSSKEDFAGEGRCS